MREGKLRFAAERYALADFTVRYTRRQTALRTELLALYRAADLRPERTDRVLARFDAKDRAEAERVLESLLTGGELIALAPRLCLHREVYVCACALVRAYFADHETLTLAAFRDLLGTSRDSALLVLECLDRNGPHEAGGRSAPPGAAPVRIAFPWGWMGAGVPRGLQNRLREAQNLPDEFDPHTPSPEKRESGGSAEPPLSCSFCCGKIRYLVENGRFLPQNVVIDTHGLTNGGE